MDFRAVKIILATFLIIAFVTPFFRLSVAMPKKGNEENVTYAKPAVAGTVSAESATLAWVVRGVAADSTSSRRAGE